MTSILPFGIDLTTLLSVGSFALFFTFIFFGQRIQYYNLLGSIRRSLVRLDAIKDQARRETIDYFVKTGKKTTREATERIDQFLNYVTIMPVDLDPSGIVQKIGHLSDTADDRMRSEVKGMMTDADPVTVSVAQNLLEIAAGLNMVDKVVRHYYLSARKTSSYVNLAQLQMSLPQILEQASTVVKAIGSIELAQPIGDGVGPMVAAKFLGDAPMQAIAKDTVLGVTEYNGRSLYVIKAEGPMGHVGQPGVAMRKIVEEMGVPIKSIIMVDAAAKLEGEETGEVAEGMGAAIGGIGVEKFQIEELSSKHGLPVYAVLVKEGDLDVMATMKKEITEGVQKAVGVVGRIIEEKTSVGDKVLLAGIGNTLGVGQ